MVSVHTCDFCDAGDVPAVAVLLDPDRVAVEARACEAHVLVLGLRVADPWFVVLDGAPAWVAAAFWQPIAVAS